MLNNIVSHIGIFFIKLLGRLPFWFLYRLSDVGYYLMILSGYRKKIVFQNLHLAFPEKSDQEIKAISRKFFRHLCDMFIETFKMSSLREKQIRKRIQMENTELLDRYYDEGKDVIVATAHYNNWEWTPSLNLFIKAQGCGVYHPLKNKPYDRFMLKLRSTWGTLNFTMKASYRSMHKLKMENKRFAIGMISDQSPVKKRIQYYNNFFNQLTPSLTGAAKMSIKTNSPMVFMRMDKIKRGYYKITIEPLVENPQGYTETEITDMYTRCLEDIIREKPEFWLWSHNRWKHKKINK
ncbi:lipid A biosynthesis acyltransferase [Labilibacter sediminis]|nr:lipid A biosynthesis acyltransferase [Labilibacter sediminis]